MKRKEFFQLIQPLPERLFRFAFNIIPDDLQAEQIVIDGLNAYLIKQKKNILNKEFEVEDKKNIQIMRKNYFKSLLSHIAEIGARRYMQLSEQMKMSHPKDFGAFFSLEPKVRIVLTLRYDFNFSTTEIEDILKIPRYEVIERLHNGRFLLLNRFDVGRSL